MTDPDGLSSPAFTPIASVTVNALDGNRPPAADAGPDQEVPQDGVFTLDGSGSSDPNGDELTYAWAQISGSGTQKFAPSLNQITLAEG